MPWQGALILLPWSAPNAGPCGTDWCLLLGNSSKRETPKPVVGRCLPAERALRSLQGSFASLCHHLRPRRNEAACGCCCRSTSNEETTMVGAICTASFFSFSYVLLICSSVGSGSTRNRQLEEGFSSIRYGISPKTRFGVSDASLAYTVVEFPIRNTIYSSSHLEIWFLER